MWVSLSSLKFSDTIIYSVTLNDWLGWVQFLIWKHGFEYFNNRTALKFIQNHLLYSKAIIFQYCYAMIFPPWICFFLFTTWNIQEILIIQKYNNLFCYNVKRWKGFQQNWLARHSNIKYLDIFRKCCNCNEKHIFLILAAIQKKKGNWKKVHFSTSFHLFIPHHSGGGQSGLKKFGKANSKLSLHAVSFVCLKCSRLDAWLKPFSSCSHRNRRNKCPVPPNVQSHVCVCHTEPRSYTHTKTHSLQEHMTSSETLSRTKRRENITPNKQTITCWPWVWAHIIANLQEANYKKCQYRFPLNSHNKKQHC